MTFGTLNGMASEAKVAHLLIDAARMLSRAAPGAFRLVVHGHVPEALAAEARRMAGIELRGPYAPNEVDKVLDGVDVGLVPSIWEEAYGYVGMEFLAKGIPVIANAIRRGPAGTAA